MVLPTPLPDNPTKWDGWRNYSSANPYERLCLSFESNPSAQQIEEHCRQLLIWWQKKLPLKNQPSNPVTQMLRAGIDEAPKYLAEARTQLLNQETRAHVDAALEEEIKMRALEEFHKFLAFALSAGVLSADDETSLYRLGQRSGLTDEEMKPLIEQQLIETGAKREEIKPVEAVAPSAAVLPAASPAEEFRRLLALSGLDEHGMSDDQRDALCNMGENLGLTGGQAEDLIDEYLEEQTAQAMAAVAIAHRPARVESKPAVAQPEVRRKPLTNDRSTLTRAQERAKYPNFHNSVGMEMLLVPSGEFVMGSNAPGAPPNEQPVQHVTLSCFYMSRFPVTNSQYEEFLRSHLTKRAPWADGSHPVIYVTSLDAEKFCEWLSAKERRKYRLPTEAEWEYAARGIDGRTYPWGEKLNSGLLANFADRNTSFPWRDVHIDDGFPETSPVGKFPRGASPFGMEDMAGNVWEWCWNVFENYKGKDLKNPRGPNTGPKRVYRGGSWKSRAASLRTTTRGYNLPNYLANDVGFRVLCECD
jgi:formylglycine-generating enzyme required for sulfatase activity